MNMNFLKALLIALVCLDACTAKLCMFVGPSCAAGGSTTTNNVCHTTSDFIITDSTVYGAKYQGIIHRIMTTYTGTDNLILYSDSNCSTAVVTIDTSGYGSCQNNSIFLNGIRYSSYKLC